MADQQSIIIKKVKKGGHGGHHGGAWKIAYADFVTAMMAFFLLLWLLSAVSQVQLQGIADYFAPTVTSKSESGSGQILGGTTIAQDGSLSDTLSRPPSVTMNLPPPKAGSGGAALQDKTEPPKPTPEEIKAKAEQASFEKAQKDLQKALKALPEFKKLAKSLIVDNTPDGLRIQIVDQSGLAMFPSGKANMYPRTKELLKMVVGVINKMPQKLSISGYTDAVPMGGGTHDYTNWELSSDRANSVRRLLVDAGVAKTRISRVVGKAATDPLLPKDPTNARNRRLSILLLRGTGHQKNKKTPANVRSKIPPSIINPAPPSGDAKSTHG